MIKVVVMNATMGHHVVVTVIVEHKKKDYYGRKEKQKEEMVPKSTTGKQGRGTASESERSRTSTPSFGSACQHGILSSTNYHHVSVAGDVLLVKDDKKNEF